MLKLNLPEYDYHLKNENEKLYIYDIVRKKDVVLTPEEWVRQHFVHYLIHYKNVPKNLISIETGLNFNKLKKRSDILVYSKKLKPLILVECKSPMVELNENVLLQTTTYNETLKADIFGITNGLNHYLYSLRENKHYSIDNLPLFNNLSEEN
jgi:hypothetical protein